MTDGGGCAPDWVETFSGVNALDGPAAVFKVFDDGLGGGEALYVGGEFTTAGGVIVNGIAKWDGATWSALGGGVSGVVDGGVYGLEVFDDGLGGGPALYVGGEFTMAGGVPANNVAKWDGAAWSALGAGTNGWIRPMQVFDDGTGEALYVGGYFQEAGALTNVGSIAKWDGATWSDLNGGVHNMVLGLNVIDDGLGDGEVLYVGGNFQWAGVHEIVSLARWNGIDWSSHGNVASTIRNIEVFDDGMGAGPAIYVSGSIQSAAGVPMKGVARWQGGAWSDPGGGVDGHMFHQVGASAVYDDGTGGGDALFLGGTFTSAGGNSANRVAKWDGATWSALGAGIGASTWDEGVWAMEVWDAGDGLGPMLYIAGNMLDTPTNDDFLTRWGGCAAPAVAGDVDGDGAVNVFDLLAVLAQWGPCGGGGCPADVNGDGIVSVADLLILLANWS